MTAPEVEEFSGKELAVFLTRLLVGLVLLLAFVGTLSHFYRKQLETLGRGFVEHLGYWGMALGTLLADGFHFPVPPQFYMLVAISSGTPTCGALATIVVASMCGGYLGYRIAGRLSHVGWLASRLQRPRRLTERAFARFGYKAALIASLLPIAFSVLCYLAGLNRLPQRFFALLALCRIPRLIVFYYLVYLAWSGVGD